jgi:hypothetical protein
VSGRITLSLWFFPCSPVFPVVKNFFSCDPAIKTRGVSLALGLRLREAAAADRQFDKAASLSDPAGLANVLRLHKVVP